MSEPIAIHIIGAPTAACGAGVASTAGAVSGALATGGCAASTGAAGPGGSAAAGSWVGRVVTPAQPADKRPIKIAATYLP